MRATRLSYIALVLAACSRGTQQVGSNLDHGAAPVAGPAGPQVSAQEAATTPPRQKGIPFGLFGTWDGTDLRPGSEVLTLTYGMERPGTILARIAYARSRGLRMVTVMTGGGRARYLTDGAFDMEKWKAVMDRFDAPDIKAGVAQAVADGTLIGNVVMDEPFNQGGRGNEKNSWGPRGTMTKARVDQMCGYAKAIFPTLPEGVFQDYRLAKEATYHSCDFITSQYRASKGSLEEYRDGALELCKRDHLACSFAINVLDGGTPVKKQRGQDDYGPGDCPVPSTGGKGTYFPNCRMTPDQVREAGKVLGPSGCFLTGFRYDEEFMANPENQKALRDVAAMLATRPADRCVRR